MTSFQQSFGESVRRCNSPHGHFLWGKINIIQSINNELMRTCVLAIEQLRAVCCMQSSNKQLIEIDSLESGAAHSHCCRLPIVALFTIDGENFSNEISKLLSNLDVRFWVGKIISMGNAMPTILHFRQPLSLPSDPKQMHWMCEQWRCEHRIQKGK